MNAIIDYKELENLLAYLENKTEDIYSDEVKQKIDRFLNNQVTTISSDIIK